MNDDSARRTVNWFELDRLVDGQLAPEEYRELLRQVEKDPDGWRQCAMAFLQHQAMEKELRAFSNSPESPIVQSTRPLTTPPVYVRHLSRSVKVVCGVSVALVLGITAGVSLRPVVELPSGSTQVGRSGEAGLAINDRSGTVDPSRLNNALTFERSSVAPASAPATSSFSRSSSGFREHCEDCFNQDPHLGGCPRSKNQLDRKY